jgi:hypothetical protein
MLKRSKLVAGGFGRTGTTLIQTQCMLRRFMNFDCAMWPAQDEQLGMTADKCKEEEDGYSILLSSQ